MKSLWSPYDLASIANPYPMYAKMRRENPVHLSQTGEWIITRYKEVRDILRSSKFLVGNRLMWLNKGTAYFGHKAHDFGAIHEAMNHFVLFLNPPDHTRIRKFIQETWSNKEVEQIIEVNLDILLSAIKSGEFNFIDQLSKPLPAMTICKLLGIPIRDYAYLKSLGSDIIKALDLYITLRDIKKVNAACVSFLSYFKALIHTKRQHPDGHVISRLLQHNEEKKVLSESEMVSTCILLFIAGEETSLGLTGTGIMNLISHPEKWEMLKKDNSLIDLAVDELIRFDAPVQIVGRIAGEDCLIAGKEIKKDSALTLCLGSANRDADVFESPDELIIPRAHNPHLGFGGGAHYCLGDWLAKIQTSMAILHLGKRYNHLSVKDKKLNWSSNLAIRTIQSLQVKID